MPNASQSPNQVTDAEIIASPASSVKKNAHSASLTTERHHPMEFRGKTWDYFGIWLSNLVFIVLTLGIYLPWAKVRKRRFFLDNTYLDNHAFAYTAQPKPLLRGYIIVLVVGGGLQLASFFFPPLAAVTVPLFLGVLPWLFWKSLHFKTRHTQYRGQPLSFQGGIAGAYLAYLGWPTLASITFGLFLPYAIFKKKHYLLRNLAYGKLRSECKGKALPFYLAGILMLIFLLIVVGIAIALVPIIIAFYARDPSAALPATAADPTTQSFWQNGMLGIIPLIVILALILIFPFWYVFTTKPILNSTRIGPLHFQCLYKISAFFGIFLTNILAIVATVGLAIPWAQVRLYRYKIEKLSLFGPGDALEQAVVFEHDKTSATAEVTGDLFDFELGL